MPNLLVGDDTAVPTTSAAPATTDVTFDATGGLVAMTYVDGRLLTHEGGGATNWGTAGAFSSSSLTGDGALTFTVDFIGAWDQRYMVGLSSDNPDEHYNTIEHAIFVNGTSLQVYENQIQQGAFGNVVIGDTLSVERNGTSITYLKNDEVFYTSTVAVSSDTPLHLDAAFYGVGVSVANLEFVEDDTAVPTTSIAPATTDVAVEATEGLVEDDTAVPTTSAAPATTDVTVEAIEGLVGDDTAVPTTSIAPATSDVTFDATGGLVAMTYVDGRLLAHEGGGATTWGTAGAFSSNSLSGDGSLSFEVDYIGALAERYMVGLSSDNPDEGYGSIEHAIYISGTELSVFENKSGSGVLGTVALGDTLSVARSGTSITYLKNDVVFHTSSVAVSSDTPLYLDSAFYGVGGSVANLQFGGDDIAVPTTSAAPATSDVTVEATEGLVGDNTAVPTTSIAPATSDVTFDATGGLVAMTYVDGRLAHAGGQGSASALSSSSLTSDGSLRFTVDNIGTWDNRHFVGLSSDNPDESWDSIDYSIYFVEDVVRVYENGVKAWESGSAELNDTFSIERSGTSITYLQNDEVFYTSSVSVSSDAPLYVDTYFNASGGGVANLQFVGDDTAVPTTSIAPATSDVTVEATEGLVGDDTPVPTSSAAPATTDVTFDSSGGLVAMTYVDGRLLAHEGGGATTWGTAGAFSSSSLTGDGSLKFTVDFIGDWDQRYMVGLSSDNPDEGYGSIEHAIYISGTDLSVFENKSGSGILGTVALGDTLSVARSGTSITYLKNDEVFYTSSVEVSSDTPLHLDSAFYGVGGSVANLQLGGDDIAVPTTSIAPTTSDVTVEATEGLVGDDIAVPTTSAAPATTDVTVETAGGLVAMTYADGRLLADEGGYATTLGTTGTFLSSRLIGGASLSSTVDYIGTAEEHYMVGLSSDNPVYFAEDVVSIYENGVKAWHSGSVALGDTFSIARSGTSIIYLQNDEIFHTSSVSVSRDGSLQFVEDDAAVPTTSVAPATTEVTVEATEGVVGDDTPVPTTSAAPETTDVTFDATGGMVAMDFAYGRLAHASGSAHGWGTAGAFSSNSLTGDGALSFTVDHIGTMEERYMVGLSSDNPNEQYNSIEYAIYIVEDQIRLYENGLDKGVFSTAQLGDTLSVARSGTSITYLKNYEVLHTSSVAVSNDTPLYLDSAFYGVGGSVANLQFVEGDIAVPTASAAPETTEVAVETTEVAVEVTEVAVEVTEVAVEVTEVAVEVTDVTIDTTVGLVAMTYIDGRLSTHEGSGATTWDTAGAFSSSSLTGDGALKFTVDHLGTNAGPFERYLLGLSSDNPDAGYNSVEYGVYIVGEQRSVVESGVTVTVAGAVAVGDTFSIERDGTSISYLQNDEVFHTSSEAVNDDTPLYLDSAFIRGSVANLQFVEDGIAVPVPVPVPTASAAPATTEVTYVDVAIEGDIAVPTASAAPATTDVTTDVTFDAAAGLGGVTYVDGRLSTPEGSGATAWGTAGAVSSNSLTGDGALKFTVDHLGTNVASFEGYLLGLSSDNLDAGTGYNGVGYGVLIIGDQRFVVESGDTVTVVGAVAVGDTFSIKRNGTSISYLQNDEVFHTSSEAVNNDAPLFLDSAFIRGSVANLQFVEDDTAVVTASAAPTTTDVTVEVTDVTFDTTGGLVAMDFADGRLAHASGSAPGWGTAGAFSSNALTGAGALNFTVDHIGTFQERYMVGLSSDNPDEDYRSIEYAMYIAGNRLDIYENGVHRGDFTRVEIGDVLSIERNGTSISYLQNDEVFHTSSEAVINYTPLYVDSAFLGGSVANLQFVLGTTDVTFDARGGTVAMDFADGRLAHAGGSATGWGTAGAFSSNALRGDGALSFTVDHIGTTGERYMVGLSSDNPNEHFSSIEYAIYIVRDEIRIYENGLHKGLFSTAQLGDTLSVVRSGTSISYVKNDEVFHTSSEAVVSIDTPLYLDSAFHGVGGRVANLQFVGGDVGPATTDVTFDWAVGLVAMDFADGRLAHADGSAPGWGSAGAFSSNHLEGDGALNFTVDHIGTFQERYLLGLSSDNPDEGYYSVEYGVYILEDKRFVIEDGVTATVAGAVALGDTFSIERNGTSISYLQNDEVFHTSSVSVSKYTPLYVDSAFLGGSVGNLHWVGADVARPVVLTATQNEVLQKLLAVYDSFFSQAGADARHSYIDTIETQLSSDIPIPGVVTVSNVVPYTNWNFRLLGQLGKKVGSSALTDENENQEAAIASFVAGDLVAAAVVGGLAESLYTVSKTNSQYQYKLDEIGQLYNADIAQINNELSSLRARLVAVQGGDLGQYLHDTDPVETLTRNIATHTELLNEAQVLKTQLLDFEAATQGSKGSGVAEFTKAYVDYAQLRLDVLALKKVDLLVQLQHHTTSPSGDAVSGHIDGINNDLSQNLQSTLDITTNRNTQADFSSNASTLKASLLSGGFSGFYGIQALTSYARYDEDTSIATYAANTGFALWAGLATVAEVLQYKGHAKVGGVVSGIAAAAFVGFNAGTFAPIAQMLATGKNADGVELTDDHLNVIKAEVVLQGTSLALGVIEGGLSIALLALNAGTKAASVVTTAIPLIGAIAAVVGAINPLKWAEFEGKQDRIDAIRETDTYSSGTLSELLGESKIIEEAFYGTTTGLNAVTGVTAGAIAATGIGAPIAAVVAVIGGGLSAVIGAFEQVALEDLATKYANKLRTDENGNPQTIEEFFAGSFEDKQDKVRERYYDFFTELVADDGTDQILALGGHGLDVTDVLLAAFTRTGGEFNITAQNFIEKFTEDGWQESQVLLGANASTTSADINLPDAHGDKSFLTFTTPLFAAGDEQTSRRELGKNKYHTTVEITNLSGWTINDYGSNETSFNLSKVVVSAQRLSGSGVAIEEDDENDANGVNDAAVPDSNRHYKHKRSDDETLPLRPPETHELTLTINAHGGDDTLFAYETGVIFDGGTGIDTASYARLNAENSANGIKVSVFENDKGAVFVHKTALPGGKVYKETIESEVETVGKRTETVEYRAISLVDNKYWVDSVDTLRGVEIIHGSSLSDTVDLTHASYITHFFGFGGNDDIRVGESIKIVSGGAGQDQIALSTSALNKVFSGDREVFIDGGEGSYDIFSISSDALTSILDEYETQQLREQLAFDVAHRAIPTGDANQTQVLLAMSQSLANIFRTNDPNALKKMALFNTEYVKVGLIDQGLSTELNLHLVDDYRDAINGVFSNIDTVSTTFRELDVFASAATSQRGAVIFGGNHNDALEGSKYDDYLYGGLGVDIFFESDGNDILVGGPGRDIYSYGTYQLGDESRSGHDIITGPLQHDIALNIISISEQLAPLTFLFAYGTDLVVGLDEGRSVTVDGFYDLRGGSDVWHIYNSIDTPTGLSLVDHRNTIVFNIEGSKTDDEQIAFIGRSDSFKGTEEYRQAVETNYINFRESGGWSALDPSSNVTADFATSLALAHEAEAGGAKIDPRALGVLSSLNEVVSSFEQIAGGDGVDTITGTNDHEVIHGGSGLDILDGGAGFDIASYQGGASAIKFDLRGDQTEFNKFDGNWVVGDQVTNFEGVIGSAYNDILIGNAADNYFSGGNGADKISGGAGNDFIVGGYALDTLDGGVGFDIVNFKGSSAIKVDLRGDQTAFYKYNGNWVVGDQVSNFEGVIGAEGGDLLTGNAADNYFNGKGGHDIISGGAGNDIIYGGTGGDTITGGDGNDLIHGGHQTYIDRLDGGDGFDVASFEGGERAIKVDLRGDQTTFYNNAIGSGFTDGDGFTAGDSIANFEGAIGTSLADIFIGNDDDNYFLGGAGNDSLTGGAGADIFAFGLGSDHDTIHDYIIGIDQLSIDTNIIDDVSFNQVGEDVRIDIGSESSIVLLGVNYNQFLIEDHLFS